MANLAKAITFFSDGGPKGKYLGDNLPMSPRLFLGCLGLSGLPPGMSYAQTSQPAGALQNQPPDFGPLGKAEWVRNHHICFSLGTFRPREVGAHAASTTKCGARYLATRQLSRKFRKLKYLMG